MCSSDLIGVGNTVRTFTIGTSDGSHEINIDETTRILISTIAKYTQTEAKKITKSLAIRKLGRITGTSLPT